MPAVVPTVDTPTNVYRGTSNIALPAEVSQEIWAAVLEDSIFSTIINRHFQIFCECRKNLI